ncbi:MAG: peptidoglycan-N-acetylglucosamine deacetylase [Synergistaceae bacterium]|jgi:peptidoglycan/xylan/chitin deacetylase (PgdA/CDA1 family)|nr:peptidoglycan-N-acetylglucosamine deacetylase [Synergistaceae bacterium]
MIRAVAQTESGAGKRKMKRNIVLWALLACLASGAAAASALPPLGKGKGRTVAITFDDGPRPGYVEPLLDILREKGVRATFFVVGRYATEYPHLVRAMAGGGHVVGDHTYYHNNLTTLPPENVYREWRLCSEAIESILGKKPRSARPPGGQLNSFVVEQAAGEGLRIVLWTNNPGDYTGSLTAQELTRKVLAKAAPGDILLLHVGVRPTIEALPGIIDGYRKKGFSFVTVEDITR